MQALSPASCIADSLFRVDVSDTPVIISDGAGNYLDNLHCVWLLTTSRSSMSISFSGALRVQAYRMIVPVTQMLFESLCFQLHIGMLV